MNIAVIAPCLFPNDGPLHYLLDSCRRFSIPLQPYGVGQQFAGWARMVMEHGIPAMDALGDKGHTHVLYVDGRDSLLVSNLDEIIWKYKGLGNPQFLMSADSDAPERYGDRFIAPGRWKYLNAGGFMGEIAAIVGTFKELFERHSQEGDYQQWFIRDWPVAGVTLDYECEIFQPMDGTMALEVQNRRVVNRDTGSTPCALHFRGGYSDPITGRDDRMKAWVEALWNGD